MHSKKDAAFNLWVLLEQARVAVYNARKKELTKYSISPREAATLGAIMSLGVDATPAKLARWVYRRPHTVAGILSRMRRKGLISLYKDEKNRHLVRISLTEDGERVYVAARQRVSIYKIFKKTMSNDAQDTLESYLISIRDEALKQTGDRIQRPFP